MIGLSCHQLGLVTTRSDAARRTTSNRAPIHVASQGASVQQVLERCDDRYGSSAQLNGPATAAAAPASSKRRSRRDVKQRRGPVQSTGRPGRVPWSVQHAEVLKAIRDRDLIEPGSKVLVAVSGGQDSMCLLLLLSEMRRQLQLDLAVAHCDHRVRLDSAANAAFVEAAAARFGVPFALRVAAPGLDLSKEAEARSWRYQQLQSMAQELGCAVVVTGHTATDRAETLLFNMVRGSGLDGLAAMKWKKPLAVDTGDTRATPANGTGATPSSDAAVTSSSEPGVMLARPLMCLTRQQTLELCQEAGLEVYEDSTNEDLRYSRNRIRLGVMPQLLNLNPQAPHHLSRLAELAAEDSSYLNAAARATLDELTSPSGRLRGPGHRLFGASLFGSAVLPSDVGEVCDHQATVGCAAKWLEKGVQEGQQLQQHHQPEQQQQGEPAASHSGPEEQDEWWQQQQLHPVNKGAHALQHQQLQQELQQMHQQRRLKWQRREWQSGLPDAKRQQQQEVKVQLDRREELQELVNINMALQELLQTQVQQLSDALLHLWQDHPDLYQQQQQRLPQNVQELRSQQHEQQASELQQQQQRLPQKVQELRSQQHEQQASELHHQQQQGHQRDPWQEMVENSHLQLSASPYKPGAPAAPAAPGTAGRTVAAATCSGAMQDQCGISEGGSRPDIGAGHAHARLIAASGGSGSSTLAGELRAEDSCSSSVSCTSCSGGNKGRLRRGTLAGTRRGATQPLAQQGEAQATYEDGPRYKQGRAWTRAAAAAAAGEPAVATREAAAAVAASIVETASASLVGMIGGERAKGWQERHGDVSQREAATAACGSGLRGGPVITSCAVVAPPPRREAEQGTIYCREEELLASNKAGSSTTSSISSSRVSAVISSSSSSSSQRSDTRSRTGSSRDSKSSSSSKRSGTKSNTGECSAVGGSSCIRGNDPSLEAVEERPDISWSLGLALSRLNSSSSRGPQRGAATVRTEVTNSGLKVEITVRSRHDITAAEAVGTVACSLLLDGLHTGGGQPERARAWREGDAHEGALPVPLLRELHPALQSRVVRLWLRDVLQITPSYEMLRRVMRLVEARRMGKGSRAVSVGAGMSVVRRLEWLEVERKE